VCALLPCEGSLVVESSHIATSALRCEVEGELSDAFVRSRLLGGLQVACMQVNDSGKVMGVGGVGK
jgi:hypothetical protein